MLRSDTTMRKYINFIENRKEVTSLSIFDDDSRSLIQFKYWKIVENEFPYDAIASVNHMLVLKRKEKFDWRLLSEQELLEYRDLQYGYIQEKYDVIYENLPASQTVPGRFHIHLLKLIRD